jgi:starch synthase
MKVLSVTSELYPLIKTGGLADVTGALPLALAGEGVAVATLVPGYPAVLAGLSEATTILPVADLFGGEARIVRGVAGALDVIAIDAPHLFGRPGNPYQGPGGIDWPDNAFRFAALGRVAASLALGQAAGFQPDILHLHDWQAGLAAAYLRQQSEPAPGIVTTIHNLAFQGLFPATLLSALGLQPSQFGLDGVEFHGAISYLKSALVYADRVTTVSPTYADEIRSLEGGMGLDGVLRARGADMVGILNGIDTDVWNPETDTLIAAPYGRGQLARRDANKGALQRRFGLKTDKRAALCGVVSRLSWQKGLDILLDALPVLRGHGMQLAVLGSGEPGIEAGFRVAAEANAGQFGCVIGYDESLAHLIQAGADFLLVPSRFEPCGLTQLCALRYGCVPVVSRSGGLADTVIDANAAALTQGVATGVQLPSVTRAALDHALGRVATLWRDQPAWRRVQRNGMGMDVSWKKPAAQYAGLFRSLQKAQA